MITGILVAFGVLVVIVLFIIAIGGTSNTYSTGAGPTIVPYSRPNPWITVPNIVNLNVQGPIGTVPGLTPILGTQNIFESEVCLVYQFPTTKTEVNGVETIIPGLPTLSTETLNMMTPLIPSPTCIDVDQINAQLIKQRCINTSSNDSICLLVDGGTTGPGGTQSYYQECNNIPSCVGQLATLSVSYNEPTSPAYCIVNNGVNPVTQSLCDITQDNQLMRITRKTPGENPSSSQNGLVAQIYNRASNLCLRPQPGASTLINYDSSNWNYTCGSGQVQVQPLLFTSCNDKNSGYNWVFVPNSNYCNAPDPDQCNPNLNPDWEDYLETLPTQISYVGDYDITQIPGINSTITYNGYSGISAFVYWAVDNNIKSLFWGNDTNDSTIGLYKFQVQNNVCFAGGIQSQYLNLTLYNILIGQPICTFGNDVGCVQL